MKTKNFVGIQFKIDRPKGTVKTWDLPNGGKKVFTYPVDYGFFPGRKGEDGEGLDAFVGDDIDGHFEVFQKLKPGPSGGKVLDETKFLIGVNGTQREKIYKLYADEVWNRKVFLNAEHLLLHVDDYFPKKKARYGSGIDGMAKQAALDVGRLYGVKVSELPEFRESLTVAAKRNNRTAEGIDKIKKIHEVWTDFDRKPSDTGQESSQGSLFSESVL